MTHDQTLLYEKYSKFACKLAYINYNFLVEDLFGHITIDGKTFRLFTKKEFEHHFTRNGWFSWFVNNFC